MRVFMCQTYPPREGDGARVIASRLRPFADLVVLPAPEPSPADPFESTERWRDHFREAITRRSPAGPVHLLGYSFGGVVALEAARALEQSGRPIGYVGLIDTWRPERFPRTWGEKVAAFAEGYAARPAGERRPFIRAQARRSAAYWWRRASAAASRRSAEPAPTKEVGLLRAVGVSWVKYHAEPVTFPVSLFWCDRSREHWGGDPSLGWSPYLRGGFDQRRVGGTHFSMMEEPDIHALAAAVAGSVRDAQRGGPEGPPRPAQAADC